MSCSPARREIQLRQPRSQRRSTRRQGASRALPRHATAPAPPTRAAERQNPLPHSTKAGISDLIAGSSWVLSPTANGSLPDRPGPRLESGVETTLSSVRFPPRSLAGIGGLGEAGRRFVRPCVRRRQDPQARMAGWRRALPGMRHPGQHLKRSEQSHVTGRCRRRRPRTSMPPCAEEGTKWNDPMYAKVGNILLSASSPPTRSSRGGVLHRGEGDVATSSGRREEGRGKPYTLPAGGSEHRLGGLGYVPFAEALESQEKQLGIFFDTVVTAPARVRRKLAWPSDSRDESDAAFDRRRHCGRCRHDPAGGDEDRARDRRARGSRAWDRGGRRRRRRSLLGSDYGRPDEATISAIRPEAQFERMLTDPAYEGKSMTGLTAMALAGDSRRVLYAHLGGAPVLSAYQSAFD